MDTPQPYADLITMADIDISQLSALELKALRDNIETQLVDREALELDKLRADVLELCSSRGYTLQQVMAPIRKKAAKPKSDTHFVKGQPYRNPEDPTQVWRGFGGRPIWLREYLAKGGTMAQLTPKAAEPTGAGEPPVGEPAVAAVGGGPAPAKAKPKARPSAKTKAAAKPGTKAQEKKKTAPAAGLTQAQPE